MDRSYWTVEGTKDGQTVRWATVDVGDFERRLLEAPSGLGVGFGDIAGSLQRPTVSLTLDNTDHALDDLLLGVKPGRSKEFTGSFLGAWTFDVRFIRNGAIAYTARNLIAASAIEAAEGKVRLTLTAGSPVFREFEPETLAEWLASPGLQVGSQDMRLTRAELHPGYFYQRFLLFAADSQEKVPLIFGKATFPLIPLSDDLSWFLAGELPTEEDPQGFSPIFRTKEGREIPRGSQYAPLALTLTRHGGGKLIVYHRLPSTAWDNSTRASFRPEYESGLVGYRAGVRVFQSPFWIEQEGIEPVRTLNNVLSRTTGETISSADIEAVAEKQTHLRGSVAGVIRDVTDLEAVVESICAPTGMDVWHDGSAWRVSTAPDSVELSGPINERVTPEEVLPATPDGIPAIGTTISLADADFGAAVSSVTIDWPSELQEVYPVETKTGLVVPAYASEVERRIAGDWLDPQNAFRVRTDIASRNARPVRTVELHVSYDWTRQLYPGQLIRFRHPAIPGPEERVGQVRRMEFLAGDAALKLTVADYGPVDKPRVGLLDSFENWILYQPPVGQVMRVAIYLEPSAPEYNYTILDFDWGGASLPGSPAEYIGATLWTPGMGLPEARVSWRIIEMYDWGPGIGFAGAAYPDAPIGPDAIPDYSHHEHLTITSLNPAEAEWLIMRTHTQSPTHRPDYIRGADPVTGAFEDGTEGFYFE